jgi:hypothetical protein
MDVILEDQPEVIHLLRLYGQKAKKSASYGLLLRESSNTVSSSAMPVPTFERIGCFKLNDADAIFKADESKKSKDCVITFLQVPLIVGTQHTAVPTHFTLVRVTLLLLPIQGIKCSIPKEEDRRLLDQKRQQQPPSPHPPTSAFHHLSTFWPSLRSTSHFDLFSASLFFSLASVSMSSHCS